MNGFRLPPSGPMVDEAGALTPPYRQQLHKLERGSVIRCAFAELPPNPLDPKANSPMVAIVTNGRKVGEGSGAGTGCLAYWDGSAWRRTADDTTVGV